MSSTDGMNFGSAATPTEARQRRIRHVLEGYGVLTHDNLRELCHADGWEVPFEVVLSRAVRRGQVKQLSAELFEAGPTE
jgi:hypothetical protein